MYALSPLGIYALSHIVVWLVYYTNTLRSKAFMRKVGSCAYGEAVGAGANNNVDDCSRDWLLNMELPRYLLEDWKDIQRPELK